MNRRGFIASIGAALTALVTPSFASQDNAFWPKGAGKTATTRAWKWMFERNVDGAKQVVYGNDKAVAMFNYALDGSPRAYVINSKEDCDSRSSRNPDWMYSYSRAWVAHPPEQARLITYSRGDGPHFEMTEENVDYFLANYEDSSTFGQGGTTSTPAEYVEWHHIKETRPDKEFRQWARETHGVNL